MSVVAHRKQPEGLKDKAPGIRELLINTKIERKDPPPPREGRKVPAENPIAKMKPGDCIMVPAHDVGLTYDAVESRLSGNVQHYRRSRGWRFVTRREDGKVGLYRTA